MKNLILCQKNNNELKQNIENKNKQIEELNNNINKYKKEINNLNLELNKNKWKDWEFWNNV